MAALQRAHHPPIGLRIVTHLKDMLADMDKIPFPVKRLGPEIVFPNSEIYCFEALTFCLP